MTKREELVSGRQDERESAMKREELVSGRQCGRHCACGFAAADADDLLDHLLEVFTPDDDRSPDGVLHAEAAAGDPGSGSGSGRKRVCLCGFDASDIRGLDAHFLAAFTPADGVAPDGTRHVSVLR